MLESMLAQYGETLLRLIVAMVAGSLIGLNRFLRQKAAGLRTHGLVALGTAMATVLMVQQPDNDAQAMSRVIQGLVTGVGFIGAGVIMRSDGNRVHGLTTAAAIWTSAIVGIACGLGGFVICGATVVLALLLLMVGRPIERGVARLMKSEAAEREEDD